MPAVSPTAQEWARRVLVSEVAGHTEPLALAEAAARADARLRARLIDLIGTTGYAALVARAVRLAQDDVPVLVALTAEAGAAGAAGSLSPVGDLARAYDGDPSAIEAGVQAILAHIIGLLISFIGADLAFHLVGAAWPEVAHEADAQGAQE